MGIIESALEPINGYLISISVNTVKGWYELEIGLPKKWVFDENSEISCEVTTEGDTGRIVRISPKNNNIDIDDLVNFVKIILDTNMKISDKEKEFTNEMEKMKGMLEDKAKKYYEELDELRENSFKNINEDFAKSLHPEGNEVRKRTRRNKEQIAAAVANQNLTTEPAKE